MKNDNVFELSRRGMAFLDGGITTDSRAILTDVLARLHGAMTNPNLQACDQIAAAEALGNLLIDQNFPDHWFESVAP